MISPAACQSLVDLRKLGLRHTNLYVKDYHWYQESIQDQTTVLTLEESTEKDPQEQGELDSEFILHVQTVNAEFCNVILGHQVADIQYLRSLYTLTINTITDHKLLGHVQGWCLLCVCVIPSRVYETHVWTRYTTQDVTWRAQTGHQDQSDGMIRSHDPTSSISYIF